MTVAPAGCLSESGTGNWISKGLSSVRLDDGAVVLSKQERITASNIATAEPALRSLKYPESPVERRIVTLMMRVTYKTTIPTKLNKG
jgi:hypothetical protein